MKLSPKATRGHLIVGLILVGLALISLIVSFLSQSKLFPGLIFFFGIWGGVELGRYLEHWLSSRSITLED